MEEENSCTIHAFLTVCQLATHTVNNYDEISFTSKPFAPVDIGAYQE